MISGVSINFPISWPLEHGMIQHVVFVVLLVVVHAAAVDDDMRRRKTRCRNWMAEVAVVYDGEIVDKE
jgi:hypothetical protein